MIFLPNGETNLIVKRLRTVFYLLVRLIYCQRCWSTAIQTPCETSMMEHFAKLKKPVSIFRKKLYHKCFTKFPKTSLTGLADFSDISKKKFSKVLIIISNRQRACWNTNFFVSKSWHQHSYASKNINTTHLTRGITGDSVNYNSESLRNHQRKQITPLCQLSTNDRSLNSLVVLDLRKGYYVGLEEIFESPLFWFKKFSSWCMVQIYWRGTFCPFSSDAANRNHLPWRHHKRCPFHDKGPTNAKLNTVWSFSGYPNLSNLHLLPRNPPLRTEQSDMNFYLGGGLDSIHLL